MFAPVERVSRRAQVSKIPPASAPTIMSAPLTDLQIVRAVTAAGDGFFVSVDVLSTDFNRVYEHVLSMLRITDGAIVTRASNGLVGFFAPSDKKKGE